MHSFHMNHTSTRFNGEGLSYLYPDYLLGLKGFFKNDELHLGKPVHVTGVALKRGILEV